jgi:hypothetical protein
VTKTTLCLLVLLAGPLSGLVGRADASFVLRKPAQEPEADSPIVWLDAPARFDSPGEFDLPNTPPAQSGMASSDHSSSGPQVGTGIPVMLTSSGAAHPTEGSGLLFLADDRSQSPTFPSRLFRPPRDSVA